MKLLLLLTPLLTLSMSPLLQAQNKFYQFSSFQQPAGETIEIRSVSHSKDGTVEIIRDGVVQKGSISIKRTRLIQRHHSSEQGAAKISYKVLSDQSSTTTNLAGQKDEQIANGELVGHTVFGLRDKQQLWRLFLDGNIANGKQAIEIAELEAYENRQWFPEQPVKLGQSWPIQPGFIRHLIERDLAKSDTKASMTFSAVKQINGQEMAILSFQADTVGLEKKPITDKNSSAAISVSGTLHIDMKTMLDTFLSVEGVLTTHVNQMGQSTRITLPIKSTMTKSFR